MQVIFEGYTVNVTDPARQKLIKNFIMKEKNKLSKGGQPRTLKKFTPEEDAYILSAYDKGSTPKEMAATLDRKLVSIYSRIHTLGLDSRVRKEEFSI